MFHLTYILLTVVMGICAYLAFFTLGYFYAAVSAIFVKIGKAPQLADHGVDVTILIPSLNEGEGVVECAKTVLAQSYQGNIDAYILVKDGADTSAAPCLAHFPEYSWLDQETILLTSSPRRRLLLQYTGLMRKSDKLNWIIPKLSSAVTGILDADHRAHPDWISTSLAIKQERGVQIVQGRRWPLSSRGIFRFWDSWQNHIGSQILNLIYDQQGLRVYFTGTTAIFDTPLLQAHAFSDCITEDTDLSYRLLREDVLTAQNPHSGSYEDLSPNLYSFIARRRRWSNGHTQSFFTHVRAILMLRGQRRQRLHFLLHGQFYLVSGFVALLHASIGLFYFLELPGAYRALSVGLAATGAVFLATAHGKAPRRRPFADIAVAWLWIWPFVVFGAIAFSHLMGEEFYHFLVTFPLSKVIQILAIFGIAAPLCLLLTGGMRLRRLDGGSVVFALCTYPIVIFLDIYANLLGLSDYFFKVHAWKTVTRSNLADFLTLPQSFRGFRSLTGLSRYKLADVVWIGLLCLAVPAVAHDYAYYESCGQAPYVMAQPIFYTKDFPIEFYTWSDKIITPDGRLSLGITAEVNQGAPVKPLTVEIYDGEQLIGTQVVNRSYQAVQRRITVPLGWDTRSFRVQVSGKGFACQSRHVAATSFVQVRGKELFVNGERFLVKGIVPTFSQPSINLSMETGLDQLKAVGVNTIRLYHAASAAIMASAAKAGMLIIDQPDASTWDNADLRIESERLALLSRLQALRIKANSSPYVLIHNLGNELELSHETPATYERLTQSIATAVASNGTWPPVSYATYNIDRDLPLSLRAVNMLNTGQHYWEKGLAGLSAYKSAVYASEFGGFLAVEESPPPELRVFRFLGQWQRLLSLGFNGGVFFQSHHNYAQPVPGVISDPFSPDQPDDQRGLWDPSNKEVIPVHFLEEMYADVHIQVTMPEPPLDQGQARIKVANIRPYRLDQVRVAGLMVDRSQLDVGALLPGEVKTYDLPSSLLQGGSTGLDVAFRSHQGLPGRARVHVFIPTEPAAVALLNTDAFLIRQDYRSIEAHILSSSKIGLYLPKDWAVYRLNGAVHRRTKAYEEIDIGMNPLHPATAVLQSRDGEKWTAFAPDAMQAGRYFLKFNLPQTHSKLPRLILEGLAAHTVTLRHPALSLPLTLTTPSAAYQEQTFDLSAIPVARLVEPFTVEFVRDFPLIAFGQRIIVGEPKLFAPYYLKLEREDQLLGQGGMR